MRRISSCSVSTAEQVAQTKARGYRPLEHMTPELQEVISLINSGFFSRGDAQMFRALTDGLLWHDPYLVFADFESYSDCQLQVSQAYRRCRSLDAHVDLERRPQRQVLFRSHDSRVLRGYLARADGAGALAVSGRREGRLHAVSRRRANITHITYSTMLLAKNN